MARQILLQTPEIHHLTHDARAAIITSGGDIHLRLDLPAGIESSELKPRARESSGRTRIIA